MNGPVIDEEGNEINIDNCSICLEKMENNKYNKECKGLKLFHHILSPKTSGPEFLEFVIKI